jgi:hypothetical protein
VGANHRVRSAKWWSRSGSLPIAAVREDEGLPSVPTKRKTAVCFSSPSAGRTALQLRFVVPAGTYFSMAHPTMCFSAPGAQKWWSSDAGQVTGAAVDTASTGHEAIGLETVRCSTSLIVLPSLQNLPMVHPKRSFGGARPEGRLKGFHGYVQTVTTRVGRDAPESSAEGADHTLLTQAESCRATRA